VNTSKLLAAACYFSVFFAPFLFPIVVYFVAADEKVKMHAKKSFVSHLIPLGAAIIIGALMLWAAPTAREALVAMPFVGVIIGGIVSFIVVVWNIIKGIQVLQER
jgi:hypothetical protein